MAGCGRRMAGTQIEDNGVGFDSLEIPAGHFGIVRLHEQAELIGAHLDILSNSVPGTMLRVVLHLSPVVFKAMDGPLPNKK
jgi:nitrate/nitrite-specific signal transduction histidine kinase